MTSEQHPGPRGREAKQIFDTITGYYDRMNTLMTLGRHRWRLQRQE